ncbi:MAG: histidine phosphatase family protein [Armatimonadetes bacterium]|nr:histidine phosphatase family protein [Armatimonadota bacterium]
MTDTNEGGETRLLLVRHGQAHVNVSQVLGGMRGDTGLTALGRLQATRLRDRLATGEFQVDVLLESSLPRARETAEIIAPALSLPPQLDDDLHEIRVGDDGDGLTLEEYKRRFGWVDIAQNPHTRIDPGGESWARFMLRVGETLTRIAREHRGKTVVVVCHGGVIDGSLVHFFGMNPAAVPPARLHTINTSLTCWTHTRHNDRWIWRLDFYNDAHHLTGLDSGASNIEEAGAVDTPAEPVPSG